MNNSIGSMFNTGRITTRKFAEISSGVNTDVFDIIKRGIVIDVNRKFTNDLTYNYNVPPYSIKAAIIGEDYNEDPLGDVKKLGLFNWYKPLMSLHTISIPEIGEEVLIIREKTDNTSNGYWISRVNQSDRLNRVLARETITETNQNNFLNNRNKYGFDFDIRKLSDESNKIQPKRNLYTHVIPSLLGDVIQQGRSGSYIRHSFNPNKNIVNGVLEMGILENRKYNNSDNLVTIGKTQTKTIHSIGVLSDFTTITKRTKYRINKVGPFQDGSYQNVPINIIQTDKAYIANIAEEFYNISTSSNAKSELYRQVLGERIAQYNKDLNQRLSNILETVESFVDVTLNLMDEFLNHTHVLPEINIEIPDKEVSFKDNVRMPDKVIPRPPRRVRIATGVNDEGQPTFETITIERPPFRQPGGIETTEIKKEIKYDDIIIGGEDNKRETIKIESNEKTIEINKNLIDLLQKFRDNNKDILNSTETIDKFLSNHHFIN